MLRSVALREEFPEARVKEKRVAILLLADDRGGQREPLAPGLGPVDCSHSISSSSALNPPRMTPSILPGLADVHRERLVEARNDYGLLVDVLTKAGFQIEQLRGGDCTREKVREALGAVQRWARKWEVIAECRIQNSPAVITYSLSRPSPAP